MSATEQELKWALALKEAAQRSPNLDSDVILDLEYLCHAIVAKGNVDKAIRRLRNLQTFKNRFGIHADGSMENGMRDLETCLRAHPGWLVSFGILPDNSPFTFVAMSKIRYLHSKENLAVHMRFMFYLSQAGQCNIAAIRAGHVGLADNKDVKWQNFSFDVESENSNFSSKAYPLRVKRVILLNSSLLVRLLFQLIKPFLSRKLLERYVVYGKADSQTFFDTCYIPKDLLPASHGGTMNDEILQETLRQRLEERYELSTEFRL